MHRLTSTLRHGGMCIVVVLAGLLDLGLEIGLVFLGGLEAFRRGIGFGLGCCGIGVRLLHLGLCGGNLVVVEVVEFHDLVGQIAVHAGELFT